MDAPTQPVSAERLSVTHGLLIGGVGVALSVVLRIVDPLLQFTNIWIGLLSFAIVVTLMVILGLDIRKKIGGFWSFGTAFKSLLIMAVLLVVISTLYSFILVKYIDPEMPSKVNQAMLDRTTTMLTNMGTDDATIEKSTQTFKNGEFEAKMQPTLKNEAFNLVVGVAVYGVIGLIIAASIKKQRPRFAAPEEESSN